jgi:hypothetical protein
MRIQETDRVLKEARISRKHVAQESHSTNVFSRTWKMLTSMFKK